MDHQPSQGRYDLRIKNATYDRDNGEFECRKVESGTGRQLHSQLQQLVVLLRPAPPQLAPPAAVSAQLTVTEGKEFNLTCSSLGGSPPPEVSWYSSAAPSTPLPALYTAATSRDTPTSAVLSLVPRKEDDDTSYRCTVWNRAMGEAGAGMMEAETSIAVNCEYSVFMFTLCYNIVQIPPKPRRAAVYVLTAVKKQLYLPRL